MTQAEQLQALRSELESWVNTVTDQVIDVKSDLEKFRETLQLFNAKLRWADQQTRAFPTPPKEVDLTIEKFCAYGCGRMTMRGVCDVCVEQVAGEND